jgi:hypothetical protein
MHLKLRIGTGLAALALSANAQAQAEAKRVSPCMMEAEAVALFSFALPEMLDTVASKCAKTLPPTSFIATRAPALVASYRTTSAANWPLAKAAFFKSAGEDDADATKILAAMPDDALKALVGTALTVIVGNDIKPADCPKIDTVVASLAPLPMTNISTLLVGLISLAGSGKDDDKFKICAKS